MCPADAARRDESRERPASTRRTRARPKRDRSVSPVFVVARRAAHPAGAARARAERWQTKLDGGPGVPDAGVARRARWAREGA